MTPELPEAVDGKCSICADWLYFEAAREGKPPCFVCKKCGRRYQGAQEWAVQPPISAPPAPPGFDPATKTPDPPMPSWYRRRKR